MSEIEFDISKQQPNQQAMRRVLEILAGWKWAIENDKRDPADATKVLDLYHECCNLPNDSFGAPSLHKIEEFVKVRILPMILNGV